MFLWAGRRGQGCSSEAAHHHAWLLSSSAGVSQNPMFWCPAPLPAGKAELAVKPPRAVKDKGGQFFLPVPLELLAEVFPSGKGSRWP